MSKENNIRGRTAVQKITYFVSVLLGIDLGFFPHYYGPYSRQVASTLEGLVDLDFIEDCMTYTNLNRVMHSLKLNDDGKKLSEPIIQNNKEEAKKIKFVVKKCDTYGQNYDILSWAAKIHWILKEKGTPINEYEIISLAKSYDWKLTQEEIDSAKKLLFNLGLAETSKT